MNWIDFKEMLTQHADLHLQFEYEQDKLVASDYHITEIKLAKITSVDCGGTVNNWNEVVLQLIEPESHVAEKPMPVNKALSIINLVESKITLDADATVKIEFGNNEFATRQMHPAIFITDNNYLKIQLTPDFTQCKAISRGETCGPKPNIQLVNLATNNACCTPGGGCC